jgi:hypothetical protein
VTGPRRPTATVFASSEVEFGWGLRRGRFSRAGKLGRSWSYWQAQCQQLPMRLEDSWPNLTKLSLARRISVAGWVLCRVGAVEPRCCQIETKLELSRKPSSAGHHAGADWPCRATFWGSGVAPPAPGGFASAKTCSPKHGLRVRSCEHLGARSGWAQPPQRRDRLHRVRAAVCALTSWPAQSSCLVKPEPRDSAAGPTASDAAITRFDAEPRAGLTSPGRPAINGWTLRTDLPVQLAIAEPLSERNGGASIYCSGIK